ncbi:hypothetical protein WR25_21186 [Diploscapter pachys]|uniref:palmitoyl-protein hydrolase n=1 Tax=Diploscapter pachys TaxID=2018661 RepID=A0A2A2LDD1_9BILA|nr:hypothetical protein WR25_21186 [Diploscapter pachys]
MRMCAGLEWNAGRCGKAEGGPEESKKRGLVGFGSEKAVQRGGASMAVTRSPAGFHYFRFLLQLISQIKNRPMAHPRKPFKNQRIPVEYKFAELAVEKPQKSSDVEQAKEQQKNRDHRKPKTKKYSGETTQLKKKLVEYRETKICDVDENKKPPELDELDQKVVEFLQNLKKRQDVVHEKNPVKAHAKRRLVFGMHEAYKHLRAGNLKMVIVAKNFDDDLKHVSHLYNAVLSGCCLKEVPFVSASTKKLLSRAVNKFPYASVIGFMDYAGFESRAYESFLMKKEKRGKYGVGSVCSVLECVSNSVSCAANSFFTMSRGPPPPVVINAKKNHVGTVIFLHGLGDQGHGWADVFHHEIRDDRVKYICPNSASRPVTLNMGMSMPAWYDLYGLDPNAREDEEGIAQASQLVHNMIDQEIAAGIPASKIIVGGFSMGGALAIYAGLTYPQKLGGIIGLSSFFLQRTKFPGNYQTNLQTPIFLGHGANDFLVPLTFGQMSEQLIKKFNPNVQLKIYPGMAHSSCTEELQDVKKFITERI